MIKNIFKHRFAMPILVFLVVSLLFFGTPIGSYAISLFQKTLAGMGQMLYTNEVTVTDIKVASLSKVTVTIESNNSTVADRVYSAYLYLDDVKWATPQTVSFSAGEIPGTKKKVTFTGLSLATVSAIDVDITY